MAPKGFIIMTLVILWPFLWHSRQVKVSTYLVKLLHIYPMVLEKHNAQIVMVPRGCNLLALKFSSGANSSISVPSTTLVQTGITQNKLLRKSLCFCRPLSLIHPNKLTELNAHCPSVLSNKCSLKHRFCFIVDVFIHTMQTQKYIQDTLHTTTTDTH